MEKARKYIEHATKDNRDYEAEGGERVFTKYGNQGINGPSHANGGVDLKATDWFNPDLVYSKKLKMKDKDILKDIFNYKGKIPKGGVSISELAKNYDTSYEMSVLNDPNSSLLDINTANLNLNNKYKASGNLAGFQEALKREKMPKMSEGFLEDYQVDPNAIFNNKEKAMNLMAISQAEAGMFSPEQPVGMEIDAQIPKKAGGGEVQKVFDQIRTDLNLTESDSEILGDYEQQLRGFYNFFIQHPNQLEKLYNEWKNNGTVKEGNYSDYIKSKRDFLDYYVKWLYTKKAWLHGKEGGHDDGYWDAVEDVPGNKAENGEKLERRNRQEYHNEFRNFAGIDPDSDNVRLFQTMDIALNDYAKNFDVKGAKIATADVWKEDPNSNAGYSSTTMESGRKGVSVPDNKPGKRTVDMLPFIQLVEDETEPDVDHYEGKERTFDPRWYDQDKANVALALSQLASIQRQRPNLYRLPNNSAGEHYQDYRATANAAAANAASISNAFKVADPTAKVASEYALAMATADATRKAMMQEQAENVRIANEAEWKNAALRDKYNAANLALRQEYDKGVAIEKQQAGNSYNQALNQLVGNVNNAKSNTSERNFLASEQYAQLPDGRIIFTGDKGEGETDWAKGKSNDIRELKKTIKEEFPTLSDEDIAKLVFGSFKRTDRRTDMNDLAISKEDNFGY